MAKQVKTQKPVKQAGMTPRKNGVSRGQKQGTFDYNKAIKDIAKQSGLSQKQLNRRIKQVLNNQKFATNAKVQTIKAVGYATAENLAPASTAAAGAVVGNALTNANNLVNAGTSQKQDSNNITDKSDDKEYYGDPRS